MDGFCKKHNVSYGKEGCYKCNENAANRPYRGMNATVWLDRNVARVLPTREDTKVSALLTSDK